MKPLFAFLIFTLVFLDSKAQKPGDSIHYAKKDTTIYTTDYLDSLLSRDTTRKINSWGYSHKSNADTVNYPISAIEEGLQGVVKVSCVVEKDGSLSNLFVVKGISADLDKEALRYLKGSGSKTPYLVNGIPLRVRLVLPVRFSLNE